MSRSRRELLRARANGLCEYCRMPEDLDVQPFQIDHVRAEKHRGSTVLENLAWACFACNSYKGPNIAGYDPETECLQPLFNPRIHDWDDHFYWDGPMLVGMTPIGRTTIDVLRINAEERVWLREQLMENGEYPI